MGSLFPNNIASHCQSHQDLNVHLLFDPQIPVQEEIPSPEHLHMHLIPLGWMALYSVLAEAHCPTRMALDAPTATVSFGTSEYSWAKLSSKFTCFYQRNASDKPNSQSDSAVWTVQPSSVYIFVLEQEKCPVLSTLIWNQSHGDFKWLLIQ